MYVWSWLQDTTAYSLIPIGSMRDKRIGLLMEEIIYGGL